VQAGEHRTPVPAVQFDALGVQPDVDDAVRDRPDGEPEGEPDQRRRERDDQQPRRVDREPGPEAVAAAPPGDERATEREAEQRTALDRQHRHGQAAGREVEAVLHGRDAGRPGRGHQPGNEERHPGRRTRLTEATACDGRPAGVVQMIHASGHRHVPV
jgi:hypothetical protein